MARRLEVRPLWPLGIVRITSKHVYDGEYFRIIDSKATDRSIVDAIDPFPPGVEGKVISAQHLGQAGRLVHLAVMGVSKIKDLRPLFNRILMQPNER